MGKSEEFHPLIGESTGSFADAFPAVTEVHVRIEERNIIETQKIREYTIDTVVPHEACSSDICSGGGVRLDDIIGRMVATGDQYGEFTESCSGVEKPDRQPSRPCVHSFEIEIEISYE